MNCSFSSIFVPFSSILYLSCVPIWQSYCPMEHSDRPCLLSQILPHRAQWKFRHWRWSVVLQSCDAPKWSSSGKKATKDWDFHNHISTKFTMYQKTLCSSFPFFCLQIFWRLWTPRHSGWRISFIHSFHIQNVTEHALFCISILCITGSTVIKHPYYPKQVNWVKNGSSPMKSILLAFPGEASCVIK